MRDVTNDSDGSSRLLSNAGFPAIDFFSLDVEGAEEKVLRTAKLANFKMIMHEVSMPLSAKDTRVMTMLANSGFKRAEALEWNKNPKMGVNQIWVREDQMGCVGVPREF